MLDTANNRISYEFDGYIIAKFSAFYPFDDYIANKQGEDLNPLIGIAFKIARKISDFDENDLGKNSLLVVNLNCK